MGVNQWEWKEADFQGDDFGTIDGLKFTFDVADPEDDISLVDSIFLLDKSGE